MALNQDTDLEFDGEVQVSKSAFSSKFGDSQTSLSSMKKCSNSLDRCDSGLPLSLSSPPVSVTTPPVKVIDGVSTDLESTTKEFEKLSVASIASEDEGIFSYQSASSLGSKASVSEDIEVDLFEQDTDGDTLIHIAVVSCSLQVVFALTELAIEADVTQTLNIQNDLLQTPLHLAVLTEQEEVVMDLIRKGANVNIRDKQGNTPLHLACRVGKEKIVKMIVYSLNKNAEFQKKYLAIRNCEGLTALHVAAEKRYFDIMGFLFAKGADVNIGDAKSGRTILHFAVERNDLDSVSKLLSHPDIDIDCRTFKGETPLVMAYWRNYKPILKRLKVKGATFSYSLVEEFDDDAQS